ncbi:MAG: hypothetical protein KDM91_06490 [Verrucomicrobiae bacterium]|nr:hypothetical protein [Verrucomicrobiae bacterium]
MKAIRTQSNAPQFLPLMAALLLGLVPAALFAQTPPSGVLGLSFTVQEDADGGNLEDHIEFTSATAGRTIDPVDSDIDDFDYTYTPTGANTAEVILQFKPDKWDEYTLTFDGAGGGTFVLREFDKNALKDTDTGDFTENSGAGGLPASLNGVTIETFEAVEIETPERLDFLTGTRGREVEPGDVDPFVYTYQVTGADTASAVLTFKTNIKWDEYDFTFLTDTSGTYVQRRFDKRVLKDTKTGTFTVAENTDILDPIASGIYDGVLEIEDMSGMDDDDFNGRLRVKLRKNGAFSASFNLDGREIKIRGAFDDQGKYVNQLTLRDGTVIDIDFTLEALETGFKVTGTVTTGGQVFTVDGDQRTFHPKRNPAPNAGRYTLILTGDGSPAQTLGIGDGYAVISVRSNGLALIRGKLADGSGWSANVMARQNTDLTLLSNLYRGQGSIGGRLVFQDDPGVSNLSGILHWTRPPGIVSPLRNPLYEGGFDVDRTAVGSEYNRPGKGQTILNVPVGADNLQIDFADGDLAAPLTIFGTLTNGNRVQMDRSIGRLRFNTSNGNFSGDFFDNSGAAPVKHRFHGAVLQIQNNGSGFFVGDGVTGTVSLASP